MRARRYQHGGQERWLERMLRKQRKHWVEGIYDNSLLERSIDGGGYANVSEPELFGVQNLSSSYCATTDPQIIKLSYLSNISRVCLHSIILIGSAKI
jgi:hypothetical protein